MIFINNLKKIGNNYLQIKKYYYWVVENQHLILIFMFANIETDVTKSYIEWFPDGGHSIENDSIKDCSEVNTILVHYHIQQTHY